jgi:hypothetical protein
MTRFLKCDIYYTHNRILYRIEKKEVLFYAIKQMNVKDIVLSK